MATESHAAIMLSHNEEMERLSRLAKVKPLEFEKERRKSFAVGERDRSGLMLLPARPGVGHQRGDVASLSLEGMGFDAHRDITRDEMVAIRAWAMQCLEAHSGEPEADLELVQEALSDAVCGGEGRAYAEQVIHHLARQGLKIVRIEP